MRYDSRHDLGLLQVRMGKGKGTFDHWGMFAPAGKVLFELKAPNLRVELAKAALMSAGMAIPAPVQFLNSQTLKLPAIVGLRQAPEFHAGIKVEGPIDTKIRAAKNPPVVLSTQIGHEKLKKATKAKKGLVRG